MIDLVLGNIWKKILGGILAAVLLLGFYQIRACQKAKEELRQYKAADKIRQQDKKTDKQIERYKDEVEDYSTPADLEHGFDRLRDYGE